MNRNGISALVYMVVVALLIGASGCEVSVSNPKERVGRNCPVPSNASNEQFETTVAKEIHDKDYKCLEADLEAGKARGPDSAVIDAVHRLLQDNSTPDGVKVSAVSYLLFASDTQGAAARDENIGAIRNIAQRGENEIRASAISVLGTRKSDEDIGIFSAGIRSGDEAILAYSAFALVDSCSARAQEALRDALGSEAMRSYLQKYAEKESISGLIRSRCSSVAAALPHQ